MKLLVALLFALSGDAASQILTGKDREDGLAACISSCGKQQRAAPTLNYLLGANSALIDEYCGCYCEQILNSLTADAFVHHAKTGRPSPFVWKQVEDAAAACVVRANK